MLIKSYNCQNDDDDTFNLQASCIPHSNLDDETEMKRKKKNNTHEINGTKKGNHNWIQI